MHHKRPFLNTLACATLILALPSLALAASYTVTDLGTFGGASSHGYGINASGQVTGYAYTTGNAAYHAFLYDGTLPRAGSPAENTPDSCLFPTAKKSH